MTDTATNKVSYWLVPKIPFDNKLWFVTDNGMTMSVRPTREDAEGLRHIAANYLAAADWLDTTSGQSFDELAAKAKTILTITPKQQPSAGRS